MEVVAAVFGVGALIGGLLTYSGIKVFSDTPSTAHVNTIVKNEIAAHVEADNTHEVFQNNIISIIIAAVAFGAAVFAISKIVTGVRAVRRYNANRNINNNAIEIDA